MRIDYMLQSGQIVIHHNLHSTIITFHYVVILIEDTSTTFV